MNEKKRRSSEIYADTEISSSAFSAPEMWHRLPPGLQGEILGFLTLQHANRMCRVSSDWKSSMERLALFNHGTIFLRWPADCEKRHQDLVLWQENPMLEEGTMKHLVVLEKSVETTCNWGSLDRSCLSGLSTIYAPKIVALPHALTTITFYGGKRGSYSLHGLLELSEKAKTIRLVAFEVQWNSYFRIDYSDNFLSGFWSVPVVQDCRVLTRTIILSLEAEVTARFHAMGFDDQPMNAIFRDGVRRDLIEHWLLAASAVDPSLLFWPFPDEQLQWLKTSLFRTNGNTAEPAASPVISLFGSFLANMTSRKEIWTFNRAPLKKMGIIWPAESNRELDVIDCAFLGRLLQITPGVPPPPSDIPRDY